MSIHSQNPQFNKTLNLPSNIQGINNKSYLSLQENQNRFNRDENVEGLSFVKFDNPETKSINTKQENFFMTNNNNKITPAGVNKKERSQNIKTTPTNANVFLLQIYPTFFGLVKPLVGIRARKITLYDLKFYIEEIYSVAFLKYSMMAREKYPNCDNVDLNQLLPFPNFVYDFISNKFAKKTLIDQNAMNILITLEYFKNDNGEIRIFSLFLSEIYTIDDLLFFLFIRSSIENESKILFIEKAKDETKIQHREDRDEIFRDILLNEKFISKVISTVYNSDDEIFLNQVMTRINPLMDKVIHSRGEYTITSGAFLVCLVDDYHLSRNLYEECKSISNIQFIDSKQNQFFDKSEDNNNDSDMYMNLLYYYNNQQGGYEDGIKGVLMTYIKEKEIEVVLEKYFANEMSLDDEAIGEIKETIVKKAYGLINIIFYEDARAWNASLGIEVNYEGDDNINGDFVVLLELKNSLLTIKNITDIPEELCEKFCFALLSTSQVLEQISKIILSKKNI